ncbi:MAG: hypothetical protein EOO38_05210 [Cytophagaceae bacterium]|nr:MAG: hypothetical protein EOO38_05210 [Cytophagaceae bacterium]
MKQQKLNLAVLLALSMVTSGCGSSEVPLTVDSGRMGVGSDITSYTPAAGRLSAPIPTGYYSGKQIVFSDPNFLSGNIAAGISLFGVTGTASVSTTACMIPGFQSGACQASISSYWTTVAGASQVGNDGALSINIPTGYYSGTEVTQASDTDLIAANIRSGTSIFGVTGSLAAAEAACADGALNSSACTTALSRYVTPTLGGAIAGSNGSLAITVPTGFYNGSTAATAADSALIAANIKSGASIFGVAGSVVSAYTACTDNLLNVPQCSTQASRYVTSASGNNVTAWANSSATTTISATIPTAFYASKSCSFTDAGLVASNVKNGISIFGVTGNFVGATSLNSLMTSGMFKDQGQPALAMDQEVAPTGSGGYAGSNAVPAYYRMIPNISTDNEGSAAGVISVNRVLTDGSTPWGSTTCGLGAASLDAAVSNCASVMGPNATWDGASKGNAAFGTWKLVSRGGAPNGSYGQEVWRDERTKLIWSSVVATTNWCIAAGVHNVGGIAGAQNDPNGYCNGVSTSCTGSTTCQVTSSPVESGCYEDTNFIPPSGGHGTTIINIGGKASLGLTSTTKVGWRLPTLQDIKLAEVDGIRFVLPDLGAGGGQTEWTAATLSSNTTIAWTYNSATGSLGASNTRNGAARSVRCVGR